MQKWEFHIITTNVEWERSGHSYRGTFVARKASPSHAELEKLSQEGWELINVVPLVSPPTVLHQVGATMAIQYIFKRPRPEESGG